MADITISSDDVRQVTGDPEDTLTMDAASGYTPSLGDLVAVSGDDEVDECDATDSNSLVEPFGIVVATRDQRIGPTRVTVAHQGLIEGATGLTAGTVLYNSTTAGAIENSDPTTTGVTGIPFAVAVNPTEFQINLPAFN